MVNPTFRNVCLLARPFIPPPTGVLSTTGGDAVMGLWLIESKSVSPLVVGANGSLLPAVATVGGAHGSLLTVKLIHPETSVNY